MLPSPWEEEGGWVDRIEPVKMTFSMNFITPCGEVGGWVGGWVEETNDLLDTGLEWEGEEEEEGYSSTHLPERRPRPSSCSRRLVGPG